MHNNIVSSKTLYTVLFTAILVNLLALNTWVYHTARQEKVYVKNLEDSGQASTETCNDECIAAIDKAVSIATASMQLSGKQVVLNEGNSAKEYSVSFGSGLNSSEEWQDVPGATAYVDSTKYGKIKNVVFEAGLHIPTGNQKAFVRLFNATDKHPVWFSEMWLEGGTAKLLVSPAVTLDSGNKLYQVQMKTSLKYQANLTQARLRIETY